MARRPPPQERPLLERLRKCRNALRSLVMAIEDGPGAFAKAHRASTAALLEEVAEELGSEFHAAKLRVFRREYEAWQDDNEDGTALISTPPVLEEAADLVRRLVAAGGEEAGVMVSEQQILLAIANTLSAKLSVEGNTDA